MFPHLVLGFPDLVTVISFDVWLIRKPDLRLTLFDLGFAAESPYTAIRTVPAVPEAPNSPSQSYAFMLRYRRLDLPKNGRPVS